LGTRQIAWINEVSGAGKLEIISQREKRSKGTGCGGTKKKKGSPKQCAKTTESKGNISIAVTRKLDQSKIRRRVLKKRDSICARKNLPGKGSGRGVVFGRTGLAKRKNQDGVNYEEDGK